MQHALTPAVAWTQRVAVASLLGLILLGVLWELWLAPTGSGMLALKVLPLTLALPGVLRRRLYTYRWVSLLVWLYFIEGVVRASGDRGLSAQLALLAEEERDDLPLVNLLREDVKRWREANYRNATPVTRQLLAHWSRADRPRRLFFCQREAVETVIYLNEILAAGKNPGFKPKLSPDDFRTLTEGGKPSFTREREPKVFPTLVDTPNEAGLPPLRRYGCKMATGSGKTVVMAMLITWAFCNRGRVPGDDRFPHTALVVCPNLTIHERLQVLRTDHEDSYYQTFDLAPAPLVPE